MMHTTLDAKEGGTAELNGQVYEVEPCDNRIHGAMWKNGALIEVKYFPEPDEDHASDRLELSVRDCRGRSVSWRLNVEDSLEIIEGLTVGIKCCLENGHPYDAG